MQDYNSEVYNESYTVDAFKKYISNVYTTKTNFGEMKSSVKGGKIDLIVCGHILYNYSPHEKIPYGEEPAPIYKPIDKAILAYGHIFNQEELKKVMNELRANKELSAKTEKIINDLNNLVILPIPLKPKTVVCVKTYDESGKERYEDCTITAVKWTNEEIDGSIKLKCMITCHKQGKIEKIYKVNAEELGRSLFPKAYNNWKLKDSNFSDLLQATNLGLLKPVELQGDNQSLIIDNEYIYYKTLDTVRVVGKLGMSTEPIRFNNALEKLLKNTVLLKRFENNIDMLKSLSRLIVPYKLESLNIVTAKGKETKTRKKS